MIERFAVWPVLLVVTACSPEGTLPPTDDTPAASSKVSVADADTVVPPGSIPIAAVESLVGEYRVAGVDGAELGGGMGIAVSIDGPMLSFEPTCAGFVWNIAEAAGQFAFTRAPGYGPTRQPDGSIMVCAVAVPAEFERLGEAIDATNKVWQTPANGILLEGNGRSVLLFSQ